MGPTTNTVCSISKALSFYFSVTPFPFCSEWMRWVTPPHFSYCFFSSRCNVLLLTKTMPRWIPPSISTWEASAGAPSLRASSSARQPPPIKSRALPPKTAVGPASGIPSSKFQVIFIYLFGVGIVYLLLTQDIVRLIFNFIYLVL